MDLDERLELVERNIEEVLVREDLVKLLKDKKNPSIYCGYETSGDIHLGHLVSMAKLLDFQKVGIKVKVFQKLNY